MGTDMVTVTELVSAAIKNGDAYLGLLFQDSVSSNWTYTNADSGNFNANSANVTLTVTSAPVPQMRWSRNGADLLLQVRCAVYNGTLGAGFGHRFDRIPNADRAFC
jgi:hypothetical protein